MNRAVHLLTCLMLLAAFAASRGGRVLGRELHGGAKETSAGVPRPAFSGDWKNAVVDTSALPSQAMGFGGPVPVRAVFAGGRIASVEPMLPNDETPMFFGMLEASGFWSRWRGLDAAEAVAEPVDAVTGATYSSEAAIASVRAAASAYLAGAGAAPAPRPEARTPAGAIAASLALLAAAVAPLLSKSRRLRTLLLVADVVAVGFVGGAFLSFARLSGWAGNGLPRDFSGAAPAALALAMAFLYPLFGRKSHYCLHACPFGAAQELAGRIPARKFRIPPGALRALTFFRRALWAVLVTLGWLGVSDAWLGLELFGAFSPKSAPAPVIAVALATLALSAFVNRPYCRFACPTGTLLKLSESKTEE